MFGHRGCSHCVFGHGFKICDTVLCMLSIAMKRACPEVINVFMFNSAKHGIHHAHKC